MMHTVGGRVAVIACTMWTGGALMYRYTKDELQELVGSRARVVRLLDQEEYNWAMKEQERAKRRHAGLVHGIPFAIMRAISGLDVVSYDWDAATRHLIATDAEALRPKPLMEYALLEHARPDILRGSTSDDLQRKHACLRAVDTALATQKRGLYPEVLDARRRCLARAIERTRGVLLRQLAFEALYHKQLLPTHTWYHIPQQTEWQTRPWLPSAITPFLGHNTRHKQTAPQILCELLADIAQHPPNEWGAEHMALCTLALAGCVRASGRDVPTEALRLLQTLYEHCERAAWSPECCDDDEEDSMETEHIEHRDALVLWAKAAAAHALQCTGMPVPRERVQEWAYAFTVRQRDSAWFTLDGNCAAGSALALATLLPSRDGGAWRVAARRYWVAAATRQKQLTWTPTEAIAFTDPVHNTCRLPELGHICGLLQQQLPARVPPSHRSSVVSESSVTPLPLL